jgi:arginyl-tRNA--protein-N-Asp/Glu arginylyltransferase
MASLQDLRVNVILDEEGQKQIIECMASMPGRDEQGRVRVISLPDVLREALAQMYARLTQEVP